MKSKSDIKSIKNQLEHLNEITPVFKYICVVKKINDDSQSEYIKELLRSYLKDEKRLITKEQIQKASDRLNEINTIN